MSMPARSRAGREQPALSISELTAQIKDLLEPAFASVWVVGEISNHSRHRSGHVYLTLKDEKAQLGAIVWGNLARQLRFELEDGMEVLAQGYVSLYEPRGEYRLIVQRIQPKGLGALELAFRQLREKLDREGLFDAKHKKPLPAMPRRVALVTSPTGAAVHDLLQVMLRRWPGVEIWIRPVPVQGTGAAEQIARALGEVDRVRGVDVVVLARGGGSLEDLWAFNEERLVRAVFAMRTPVVSAVGHEVDVTLADLVADRRALTPSEAGELVVPDRAEVASGLRVRQRRLAAALRARVHRARTHLDGLARRPVLRRPMERLYAWSERCDQLAARAQRAVLGRCRDGRHRAARLAAALESLSPLKVLERGYSVTLREDGQTLVKDATMVSAGERIVTRLARGRLISRVERPEPAT